MHPWLLLAVWLWPQAAGRTWARDKPSTNCDFLSDWEFSCKDHLLGRDVNRGLRFFFCLFFFMVTIFHIMFNHQCFKKRSLVESWELGSLAHWVGVFHHLHVGSGLWGTQEGFTHPGNLGRGKNPLQLGQPVFSFQMGSSCFFFLIGSHTFFKKAWDLNVISNCTRC